MDPCHTESQSELSATDRVPGIRHREGGRSEARQSAGINTAEGNKHAEEQATSPVEPRKDTEGEGKQEKTEREQGGQAGRHAKDLDAENTPSTSKPGRYVFAEAPATTRPPKQVHEELGAFFQQTLPCLPWV